MVLSADGRVLIAGSVTACQKWACVSVAVRMRAYLSPSAPPLLPCRVSIQSRAYQSLVPSQHLSHASPDFPQFCLFFRAHVPLLLDACSTEMPDCATHTVAVQVDDRILDYQWRQSVYDIGGDSVPLPSISCLSLPSISCLSSLCPACVCV